VPARILIAEDDPKQARLLRLYLEREGHEVRTVDNGRAAIEQVRLGRPDLVILDVMLPDVEGHDVCRLVRRDSQVPILMVTARTSEEDLVLALELGADDYLTKPYSPRELLARTRALLRRAAGSPTSDEPVCLGPLVIDSRRFEVSLSGEKVDLTAKEFAILQILGAEPDRVFTRAEIIDRAFGFDSNVLARTVDAHMVNLRRKLQSAHDGPVVETVYGRGYRLSQVDTP
jgi:DNA-binding response OmpR family regulator